MWHVNISGRDTTQMTEEALVQGLLNNEIPLTARVWVKGMQGWEQACDNARIQSSMRILSQEPEQTGIRMQEGPVEFDFDVDAFEEAYEEPELVRQPPRREPPKHPTPPQRPARPTRDLEAEREARQERIRASKARAAKVKHTTTSAFDEMKSGMVDAWTDDEVSHEATGYTSFGVPVVVMAGFIFLLYFGNTTAMIGLTLFILLKEDSMWLRRMAVTACAYTVFYFFVSDILSEASIVWRWIANPIEDLWVKIPFIGRALRNIDLSSAVSSLRTLVRIFFTILMVGHSIKVLKGGTVRFSRFDKYINQVRLNKDV